MDTYTTNWRGMKTAPRKGNKILLIAKTGIICVGYYGYYDNPHPIERKEWYSTCCKRIIDPVGWYPIIPY